ncbi:hypothetical protein VNI00_016465 [Paramarasmius palmivorus]|uniref:Uncharacterized protein n=1 Tax=Paramarasmius palmivorus TaxID=297713 RepID=A0AAW0BEK1_9AGAR
MALSTPSSEQLLLSTPLEGTADRRRYGSDSSAEHFYLQGFKEGSRQREAEVTLLKTQLKQACFEAAQLKVKVQDLEEENKVFTDNLFDVCSQRANLDPQVLVSEAAALEETSSNDSDSYIRVPPPSPSRMDVPASSSAFPSGRSNDRYGIPSYLSAFRSREAETALRELMEKARTMDSRALARIKNMCREAHATPRDLKSWAQSFILSEWRNPPEIAPPNIRRDPTKPALPNPRMGDPVERWFEYYSVHSSALPRGVRKDTEGRPWKPDLQASRLAAQLRPLQTSPAATRTEFSYYLFELLGTPGKYHSIVSTRGLRIASTLSPQPYDGPSPVTIEDVVLHMVVCGVTLEVVKDALEPWSRQHKTAGATFGP